jgi:co-chaperonin GroES (HSP10)
MKELIALKDKIIVELDVTVETKTESGLFIPETSVGQPQRFGRVVSYGDEVTGVKINDILIFHQKAGQDILINKKIYKVLMFGEVYGIIKDVSDERVN